MAAPDAVRELVETFAANIEDYKKSGFKEAQLRSQFLDRFLETLGWDVGNRAGYAEQYKEVIVEDSIDDEGRNRAPDYCFRVGKERKFFVEAKKPMVDVGRDRSAAYQLRRYAWSAKLPLSIVTDFEELSVYDTRVKPEQTDTVAMARVKIFHYSEYVRRWHELSDVFSKDAILKGSFDRYATKKAYRGTVAVDDDFLATLEVWRLDLANAIYRQNPALDIDEVAYVVQVTLDRILFLRICEDKGIEPLGALKSAVATRGAYAKLLNLFRDAQQKYNSGLFHLFSENKSDPDADNLSAGAGISDAILSKIIIGLYPPNPYEFSVISPEILGSVYERFLGSELVLHGRSIKSELKPEQKKAGGVYYTPAPIARYMVDRSVVESFALRSQERPRLRILDMACGSGSPLKVVLNAIRDVHAPVAKGLSRGIGLTLQNLDSEICDHVHHALMVQDIPVLSVHDSFIVGRSVEDELRSAMVDLYKTVLDTEFKPVIKKVETDPPKLIPVKLEPDLLESLHPTITSKTGNSLDGAGCFVEASVEDERRSDGSGLKGLEEGMRRLVI